MYNITGWSGGGRRPLSYNLMPGQFRNTRVNVFSNPTIINNMGGFGGYYDYGCGCGCDGGSNKMSWMDWTMMGGMLLNGLGNMFACFWGGGGGGGADKTTEKAPDDRALRTKASELATFYSDDTHKIKTLVQDGSITVKINGKIVNAFDNYDDYKAFLEAGNFDGDPDLGDQPLVTNQTKPNQALIDAGKRLGLKLSADGTKWKVGDKEFELSDLKGAVAAKNSEKKDPPPTSFTNRLFTSTSGLTSTEAEESKFKELTKTEPYKITADANGITITTVVDTGNNTSKSGTIQLTQAQLTDLLSTDGKEITLTTKFGDKAVKAKNIGGYLQIQVGEQTYIVGMDKKAYQYKDGNVTGYNNAR